MIFVLVQNHPALNAIVEPFDRDNLDIPLRGKLIFFALCTARNEMGDTFGQIFPEFGTILHGHVMHLSSKGH